jgi:hypothetical protein
MSESTFNTESNLGQSDQWSSRPMPVQQVPDLHDHGYVIQLSRFRRNRTDVWEYAGNSMHPGRLEELAMHPTVKPIALVADAIKDCSRRYSIVLDPFCGCGTTLIAAERTGRCARGIEIDSLYVDVAVRRWHNYTGKAAMLAQTSRTFQEIEEERQRTRSVGVANDLPTQEAR